MSDKEYTRKEAAKFLNVSAGTLAKWASTGQHNLPYVKLGKETIYQHSDLVELKERNTRTRASQPISN